MKLHHSYLSVVSCAIVFGLGTVTALALQAPADTPAVVPNSVPEPVPNPDAAQGGGLNSSSPSAVASPSVPAQTDPNSTGQNSTFSAPPVPSLTDPTLTVRSQKALETFEPAANEEYTLGAGDELTLEFPGRTELGGKKTIGPDGRITLPLVGPIHVADLTRDEASAAITTALGKFYTNLNVSVSVDKYSSNSVRVIGYVIRPGEVLFEGTPTLLNAISRAGLIQSSTVSKDGVAATTGNSIPELCTIMRTKGATKDVVTVQLRELLATGNALADMRLRRNDIIYVPQPRELFVSVMGQVGKPGTIPLAPESTLSSVLAQAGCCANDGGFNPTIEIIQPSTQRDFKVKYKELLTLAGQKEYTLHPGDVIYVPMSGFNKAATVIQKISPAATMVSFAAILGAG